MPQLHMGDWTFEDKNHEFHSFLFQKLDAKLAGRITTAGQTGFEMWRQLCKELDPFHPEEGRAIEGRARALFVGPCSSSDQLWEKILAQEKVDQEYFDKMGKYLSQATLRDNIWVCLTAEVARDLAKDQYEQETTTYAQLRAYIAETREFDRRYAPTRKRGTGNEMDVSTLQGENVEPG